MKFNFDIYKLLTEKYTNLIEHSVKTIMPTYYYKRIKYYKLYLQTKKCEIKAIEYNLLGVYYEQLYSNVSFDKLDINEAISYFLKAYLLDNNEPLYLKNLIICYSIINDYKNAFVYWQILIQKNVLTFDDKFDYACFCWKYKNFEGLHDYYISRFYKENNPTPYPNFSKPMWCGQDIKNKHLLIYCEQGFGDTIFIFGYLKKILNITSQITFVVQDELYFLIKENINEAKVKIIPKSQAKINELLFDYHLPSMSIPNVLRFQKTDDIIKNKYLEANKKLTNKYKKLFSNNKVKIGLSIQGSNIGNKTRDILLSNFKILDDYNNIEIYLLTQNINSTLIEENFKQIDVHNIGNTFNNFDETAAAMSNLDCIITSDNVILNLAGALGIKTYALFNFSYEFRWFDLTGDNVFYYKTVKPFVNDKQNNWQYSINEMLVQLRKDFPLVKNKSQTQNQIT